MRVGLGENVFFLNDEAKVGRFSEAVGNRGYGAFGYIYGMNRYLPLLLALMILLIACTPQKNARKMAPTPLTLTGTVVASKAGSMLLPDSVHGLGHVMLLGLENETFYFGHRVTVFGIPVEHEEEEDKLVDRRGNHSQGLAGSWMSLKVQTIEVLDK